MLSDHYYAIEGAMKIFIILLQASGDVLGCLLTRKYFVEEALLNLHATYTKVAEFYHHLNYDYSDKS